MGKASRDKGARGELEVVHIAIEHDLRAERTAQLQAGLTGHADVALLDYSGYHIEVKRDERMSVDAMVRQAYKDCDWKIPVVAWRRNQRGPNKDIPWMAALPLCYLFDLIAGNP
jgi:hypothetical protein